MPFYAHPKNEAQTDLEKHLLKTANLARMLVEGLGLENTTYYAGLMHDLGKLNPYYQRLFSASDQERRCVEQFLQQEYVRAHSVFSALAAYRLSRKLSPADRAKVVCAVAAHHSKLLPLHKVFAPFSAGDKRLENSKEGFFNNITLFSQNSSLNLDWADLLKNQKIPQLNFFTADEQNHIQEYLEFNIVFSALILADRGSFFDQWKKSKYTLSCNTDALARQSTLAHLRTEFQKCVLAENSFNERIMVLKAPTGIGKTKMFLDIINTIACRGNLDRVFYFSPLLALTEDFEGKLKQVLDERSLRRVLVYNHAFTGSLAERESELSESTEEFFKSQEYFERESFSYEFVVTTTQRLLITLYSNRPQDKMKMLAFRNALLIIDEVQTIPKFLLPNLVNLLSVIAEKFNSRILFVSATIPDALCMLPTLKYPQKTEDTYLKATLKYIQYLPQLDVADIDGEAGRVLIMVNTRRKAHDIYHQISKFREGVIYYLSSGITKRQRRKIIREINKEPLLVVSTQVLEAGVDISFDRIYREVAPLDNIVQTMGRLNREGYSKIKPLLTIFQLDEDVAPYDDLEMKLSKKILPHVSDSKELYRALQSYYSELAKAHATNKKLSEELRIKMCKLWFDEVWDFVKKKVLPADIGDTVFVPCAEKWEDVKNAFLNGKINRFAEFAAELPKTFVELDKQHNLRRMFDADLLEKNVLLPKKEHLSDIYDSEIGLDKWVTSAAI